MVERLPDPEGSNAGGGNGHSRRHRAAAKTMAVLPTMFTLGNLLCGFMAIFLAGRVPDKELAFGWTPLTWAGVFIFVGMVFDALDGRIARLMNQTSDLGGQLDSMADMVTFGVAPAYLAVQLIGIHTPFFSEVGDRWFDRVTLVISAIYVACAALRLARFNLETPSADLEDHMSFNGMPSPGAAGTVVSLVLLHEHYLRAEAVATQRWVSFILVGVMLLVALAMVSQLRYVHVTNRYVKGRAPFATVTKFVILLLVLLIWPQLSVAITFVLYALSAPFKAGWRRTIGRSSTKRAMADDESADQVTDEPIDARH